jgi:hypothetical protein
MQQPALRCWQCGTVLSAASARCNTCGTEQLAASSEHGDEAGASREPDEAGRSSSVPMWAALVVGLAVIGGAAAVLRPHGSATATAARSPLALASANDSTKTSSGELGTVDLKSVDPMEVLGRAKTRALAWSSDAVLVSMRARPVTDGRVNVQAGGSVDYWFGKPTGEGFGPGTKVTGKRLHISLESTGTKTEETSGGAGRAALEPNCPLDAAASAAQAAGITPPLLATYDVTERLLQKPIWHVSTDGKETSQRQIDGMSCAVLVR